MTEFLQQLANGLSLGSTYALVAVGLTLIFGIARVGNFAHGDFVMLAAYALILSVMSGVPIVAALLIAIATAVVLALLAERVFSRLYNAPPTMAFTAAIGISAIIQASVSVFLGGTPRQLPVVGEIVSWQVGDVILTGHRGMAILGSIVAIAALGVYLLTTRSGKAIRALAQHVDAARMVGIGIPRVRIVTMVIAGMLGGWAAVLIAPILGASPLMGVLLTLKGFSIVIVGGLGSVRGALAGAYLLGIAEGLFAGYVSNDFRHAIAFVVLSVFLLVRPGGLFGEGTVALELRR